MVGAAHGMDTSAYTIPYVSGWAMAADGKNPIQIVQATAERVRKVALEILDQLDTGPIGDGT
ncbi:MAG TPA: serine/arginine repetitive matrix protein 2, partial [Actinobacteria bacterium]|nr:serine/arginine repetitive matrix protein 2 [Actinomycetota bacterium]